MNNANSSFQFADMEILKANCNSEILKFYAGKNILLTGCTGFLGTLILEKLLRTCIEIPKIYIIVRPKKGLSIEERMKKLFEQTYKQRYSAFARRWLVRAYCVLTLLLSHALLLLTMASDKGRLRAYRDKVK